MSSRFSRKQNIQEPRRVIRVFTEGTKTEPNYFNSIRNELRLNEIEIKVDGLKRSTTSLVEWVIERKNELSRTDEDTEWWVVFDRDDHTGFNQAIQKAEVEGINVAYSNECFELWFILHFEFLNTAIGRTKYYEKLTELLSQKYDKSTSDIYDLIKDRESIAIRNAKNLEKMHSDAGIASCEKMDPSTSVYKLVERFRSLS
ncbi:RloB domain-containing protein [Candidatus Nomurabacteria bacterium]|nr:RloB domain-containing protein [Candidatus Nomurabacteria bacterium]